MTSAACDAPAMSSVVNTAMRRLLFMGVPQLKIALTDSSNRRRSRHNLKFSYSLSFPL